MWASAKLGSASVAWRQFCSAACVCSVSILARPSSKKARALADWVDISIPAGCCPAKAASANRKIETIKNLTRVEIILIDFSLGRALFPCQTLPPPAGTHVWLEEVKNEAGWRTSYRSNWTAALGSWPLAPGKTKNLNHEGHEGKQRKQPNFATDLRR